MVQPSDVSPFNPSYLGPALVGFVVGMIAGTLLVNLLAGLAIGLVLAISAIGRRYAAARMEARIAQQVRDDER